MGRAKSYDPDVALRRAVGAFWARGYSATSMRELIEVTKLVPKSLYAEFGGKDELFVAALGAYLADHKARYEALLGTPPLGVERLRRYYESLSEVSGMKGCLLVNSLAEIASIPPAAVVQVQTFFAWLESLYRQNLAAAARAGALRKDADVAGLAAALVSFDQGLAIASRSVTQRQTLARSALALLDCICA